MNKWLVSMSAAAVAAGAVAVESANTVGVITTDVTEGTYYMIGVPFESVGASSGTITFDDLIKLDGMEAGEFEGEVDYTTVSPGILMRVGSGYRYFYYISDAYDATESPVGHDCWAKDGYECTAADIQSLGDGFWFIAPEVASGATITTKGQVTTNLTGTVTFAGNGAYSIIANPFPVDVCLADIATSGVTPGEFEGEIDYTTVSAEILVRKGNGYVHYYYISDAYNASEEEVGRDCWAKDGYEATEDIAAGASFWVKSFDQGEGAITFSL